MKKRVFFKKCLYRERAPWAESRAGQEKFPFTLELFF
jgi:hypothetical protein